MKRIIRSALFIAVLFTVTLLHAQLNSADLSVIEATPLLSADELPPIGTFYSAANPSAPPAPGNIFGLPGWSIGNGIYLLDDLGSQSSFQSNAAMAGGMRAMDDSSPPGPGGGGSGYGFTNTYSGYPTNGLYLQMTGISNGLAYANLNGATDYVYEIFSSTNITADMAVSNWDIETEIFPGENTNTMPFYVYMNDRNPLFLWARDWTGITSFGNTVPEWWFYYYYGTIDLEDDNLDSQGYTLLYDYTNGLDPNVIQFSVSVTNNFINTNMVPVQLTVSAGIPDYIAVEDTTNFMPTEETWYPYTSSNIIVNLDWIGGQHILWVGLKGLPTNASVTWQETIMTLRTNAPVIVVTNPMAGTVSDPTIQIQGFADESLSGLTYDVSNAAGLFPNRTGYVIDEYYDTNLETYTTNYFQLFDVRLTNGLNNITIHATDLADNTGTSSFNITLDYSSNTNSPALNIVWPSDGTLISGNNFTLHAQIGDNTAGVTATIVDSSGDTNVVIGSVQRNGNVWAYGLPLSTGTNFLTVTATNAAGDSVTTNLMLVQSAVMVTMDPLSSDKYNQTSVDVTGTISSTNYSLTANGVAATINPTNGTWSASGVPVSATGMAVFDLEVYVGDPVNAGSQQIPITQPPVVSRYKYATDYNYWSIQPLGNEWIGGTNIVQNCVLPNTILQWWYWSRNGGGRQGSEEWANFTSICADGLNFFTGSGPYSGGADHWENDHYSDFGVDSGVPWVDFASDQVNVELDTGGEGQPGTMQLYLVEGEALDEFYTDGLVPLPPDTLKIRGQTLQDTGTEDDYGGDWGGLLLALPSGSTNLDVTPISSDPDYVFNVEATNVTLQIIDANTGNNLTGLTNTVIVGQQMNLECQLNVTNAMLMNSMLTNIQWTVPGFAISNYVVATDRSSAMIVTNFPTTNSTVTYYWVDGASNRVLQCSATIDGVTISNQAVFNVIRPTIDFIGSTGTVTLDTNWLYFPGLLSLHFGGTINNGITNYGLTCTASNPNLYGYDTNSNYGFFAAQIITTDIVRIVFTNNAIFATNTAGLDNIYPTGPLGNGNGTTFVDAPGGGGFPTNVVQYSESENFRTVIMFQPDEVEPIPVPIKEVDWGWSGSIMFTNSQWVLISSSAGILINNQETLNFPTWTNVVHNFP